MSIILVSKSGESPLNSSEETVLKVSAGKLLKFQLFLSDVKQGQTIIVDPEGLLEFEKSIFPLSQGAEAGVVILGIVSKEILKKKHAGMIRITLADGMPGPEIRLVVSKAKKKKKLETTEESTPATEASPSTKPSSSTSSEKKKEESEKKKEELKKEGETLKKEVDEAKSKLKLFKKQNEGSFGEDWTKTKKFLNRFRWGVLGIFLILLTLFMSKGVYPFMTSCSTSIKESVTGPKVPIANVAPEKQGATFKYEAEDVGSAAKFVPND